MSNLTGRPGIQFVCSTGEFDACVIVPCWACSAADLLLSVVQTLQGAWISVKVSASVFAGCESGAQPAATPLTLHRQPQSKGTAVRLDDLTGSLCQDFPS